MDRGKGGVLSWMQCRCRVCTIHGRRCRKFCPGGCLPMGAVQGNRKAPYRTYCVSCGREKMPNTVTVLVWLKGGCYFWAIFCYFLLFWASGFFLVVWLKGGAILCYFLLFWGRQPHQVRYCYFHDIPPSCPEGCYLPLPVVYTAAVMQDSPIFSPSLFLCHEISCTTNITRLSVSAILYVLSSHCFFVVLSSIDE